MPTGAQAILERALSKMNLSAREHDRILKVARTIADLAGEEQLTEMHIAEAVHFRNNMIEVIEYPDLIFYPSLIAYQTGNNIPTVGDFLVTDGVCIAMLAIACRRVTRII